MDNTEYKQYLQSDKWKAIANERLKIDNFQCVCCGSRGTPANPLEIHHLSYKYLYHEEERIYQDLVTLCHCCHKSLHNIMNRQTDEKGRRGWKDNRTIPAIHTFNVTGTQAEYIETKARY
jgi:5-methylcytosine-specific restriction endonuclease McrA